ncbi:DUF383-domain-containing protein, partial [Cylindrobasidium torrendii FP15055 ss-10]
MDAQLRELLGFLRDKNPQVRQISLEHLLPHTVKDAPHRNIFLTGLKTSGLLPQAKDADVIRDLKLLCRDQLAIAHDAFKALINLTDTQVVANSVSDDQFLNFLVSYLINPDATLADLAAMLLSNLSVAAPVCASLCTLKVNVIVSPKVKNGFYTTNSRSGSCAAPVPYPEGHSSDELALPLMLDAFVQGASVDQIEDLSKRPRKASLHFLASVFANIASTNPGRTFFLTPRTPNFMKPDAAAEYPLAKIVSFTEHKDTIRRGGTASIIKNCAFNAASHRVMLTPESETVALPPSKVAAPGIDVLPYLLLPLAGPEEFDLDDQEKLLEPLQLLPPDKKREIDEVIRLTHVETLLLLCHTRWGRDYQREHGVYEIIRAAHENETVDKISEHIERLVNLIQRGEPKSAQIEEVEELTDSTEKLSTVEAPAEDSDDEDCRIEEI